MPNVYRMADDIPWTEMKPGVRVKTLYENPDVGERTLLFETAPGMQSQPHSHDEFEQVYVLSGSFHDGERLLEAGDYCYRTPGTVHGGGSSDGAVLLVIYSQSPPESA